MRAMQHLKVSSFVALATISSAAFAQSQGFGWTRTQDLPDPVLTQKLLGNISNMTTGQTQTLILLEWWQVTGDASQDPPWTTAVAWLTAPVNAWGNPVTVHCNKGPGVWKALISGTERTWNGTEINVNSADQSFSRTVNEKTHYGFTLDWEEM